MLTCSTTADPRFDFHTDDEEVRLKRTEKIEYRATSRISRPRIQEFQGDHQSKF